ncbi:MAG: hypothetical protein ABI591_31430 [Kofleriaceae bacterium]
MTTDDPKLLRRKHRAALAVLLQHDIARLRDLVEPMCPVEAAALPTGKLGLAKPHTWSKALFDLYDFALSARVYDVKAGYDAALAAITPETALRAEADHPDFKPATYTTREDSLPAIIACLAGALERAQALATLS